MNEYIIKAGRYDISVLDFGAILYSFRIDGRDIIVGYGDKKENEKCGGYYSQVIGPFANRISNAEYSVDGKVWKAEKNDGENSLHSGSRNYGFHTWQLKEKTEHSVTLSLHSPEGFGFPGNQDAEVTYSLTEKGELTIHYSVTGDRKCPVNVTNHAFFNLNGSGVIYDHVLRMPSEHYIAVDSALIPTEICPTRGTAFDFTEPHRIGERRGGSYDHCFLLDGKGDLSITNGTLTLSLRTDLPSVQLYTGDGMNDGKKGKGGTEMSKNTAFCLETEFYPNFPNRPDFQGAWLENGKKFETETTFVLTSNS